MEHDKEHMCRILKVDVPKIGQFLTGRVLKPAVGALYPHGKKETLAEAIMTNYILISK